MAASEPVTGFSKEVSGPRAKALADRRARFVARGVSTSAPTFAARGMGAVVEDVDGIRFIDFAGGIGVLNVGYSHPEVVGAVKTQVERFFHTCSHVLMNEPYVDLAERLTQIAPGAFPKKALLANSGAEAVENAVKVARYASGRPGIISFDYSFHGRTLLTMSLTGKVHPYKYGFGPAATDIYHVPSPYCYRCPCGLESGGCEMECLSLLNLALQSRVAPDRVAAILIEPVQGEGGFIVIPPQYLLALRALCDQHGICLIVDEIQTGFGRTGKMFAIEHSGVVPDITTVAKSLGAGIPLSGVVGRADLMDAPHPGGLGGTYGGNPIACVAALKVIEVMATENLPARAERIGSVVRGRFMEMRERFPLVGDVRGLGAMVAIELVRDRRTKEPADTETKAIIAEAFKRGLILIRAGLYDNVIRVLVPLVAEDAQVCEGLDILEASIAAVSA